MKPVFHAGELEVQRGAGVLKEARSVGQMIAGSLSAPAARFLMRQRLAIASSIDGQGRVWASALAGSPGFLTAVDAHMLWAKALPSDGDPLISNISSEAPLGLLVIDPRTRQRMRFNGRGTLTPEGIFLYVAQSYGNCPKYIQLREPLDDEDRPPQPPSIGQQLNAAQRAWIERSDTLFIASLHPQAGADASHRGGRPGFVDVASATQLSFPDYPGNNLFNTLGNLLVNRKAGLLFLDFERGHALQLTGSAQLGTDRRVTFDIEECRETRHAVTLRYRLLEYSPSSPPVSCHTPA